MRLIRIALAVCAALFAAACLPVTTKTAIGTTVAAAPDPALYGMWRGADSKNDLPGYFTFLKNGDDTMTAILVSLPHGEDGGEWETFRVQAATLGGNHYMTATESFVNNAAAGDDALQNIALLYRFEGKSLTLYLIDEDAAKAAIAAGKIKGTVGQGDNGDIQITSDAAELDAFLATPEGAALFKSPLVKLTKMP